MDAKQLKEVNRYLKHQLAEYHKTVLMIVEKIDIRQKHPENCFQFNERYKAELRHNLQKVAIDQGIWEYVK